MDLDSAYTLITDKVLTWVRGAIALLPNLIVALLVLLAFVAFARLARRGVVRISQVAGDNLQLRRLLGSIAYGSVLAIGVFVSLSILDLQGVVTSLLAGVGIVGLALGIAFQDLAANFMSGVMMAVRRPFRIGDMVESADYTGVVEDVSLRSTRLRTFQGQGVRIPNSQVFGSPIVNFSDRGRRRVDLACGVAYGEDLERVRAVAVGAVRGLDVVAAGDEVELYFHGFGDSSIDFDVRFWIPFAGQRDYLHARSEAIIAIKKAFDANGITIPFPIRTLDFGAVGGETLREHLPAGTSRERP